VNFAINNSRSFSGENMNYADVFPRKSHADFVNPSFETLVRRYFYQTEAPRLETVVNKPYAGSGGKEFPLGHRRYGRRRYYVENKGTVTIKLDERVLGYVHTDDSFTFAIAPFQGDQALLNRLFPSFGLISDSRRGGVVLKMARHWSDSKIVHPVFGGLRVKLNDLTLHESCGYHVEIKHLDRKLTKQIRDKYDNELKAARGFFMAASAENIINDMKESAFSVYRDRDMYMKIVSQTERYISNAYGYGWWRNKVEKIDMHRKEIFDNAKSNTLDTIYREEEAFATKILEAGQPIPSGNWGFSVHIHKPLL
jgi:hypothetical protein